MSDVATCAHGHVLGGLDCATCMARELRIAVSLLAEVHADGWVPAGMTIWSTIDEFLKESGIDALGLKGNYKEREE